MRKLLLALVPWVVAACGDDGGDGPSDALISAAEGGEVASADGAFKLVVPPGALAEDTRISITLVPEAEWPAQTAEHPPVSSVYELEPDGLAFATPARVMHTLAGSDALRRGDEIMIAAHAMVSSDGALEIAPHTSIRIDADQAIVVAEVSHTSRHWASESIVTVRVDIDLGEEYPIGGHMSTSSIVLSATEPRSFPVLTVFAATPNQQSTVVPVAHEGWRSAEWNSMSVFQPYVSTSVERHLGFAAPSSPLELDTPLPAWACTSAGTGFVYFGMMSGRGDKPSGPAPFDILMVLGSTRCADGTPGPQTYTTLNQPEGIDLFHIGPNRPPGMPLLVAPGLPDGTYAAVAGGDASGGLDLVHLATGTRKTNNFVDASPAYGVTAYQTPTGPRWTVFGGGGTATAGWNNSLQDFGATVLGPPQNTTQVAIADVDDDGVAEKVMLTAPNGSISVQTLAGGNASIDSTAFAGGDPGSQRISAEFGRTTDEVLVVLSDGRVFFGPIEGAAGRLALVGDIGTSARVMDCAGATPRICAIPDYGGDSVSIVEIDASGPAIVASQPTGDGPIEPAIMLDGNRALVAVTGGGDNTLAMFAFDPANESFTPSIPRQTLTGCISPNHVRFFRTATIEAIVACYGGGGLQRVPLSP